MECTLGKVPKSLAVRKVLVVIAVVPRDRVFLSLGASNLRWHMKMNGREMISADEADVRGVVDV
jgi:hypothetical protein